MYQSWLLLLVAAGLVVVVVVAGLVVGAAVIHRKHSLWILTCRKLFGMLTFSFNCPFKEDYKSSQ